VKEVYKRLESETSAVRYLVAVLLGAGINFTIGVGVMLSSLSALVYTPSQALTSQSPFPTSVSILVIFYFIVGVVYATSASLTFQPKRIVSPIYVQITTSAFVPILIVALQLMKPVTDWVSISALALAYFMISLIMFFIAGIGQTPIVRYLVGLNGTRENTHSFGLVINSTIEDVLRVLRNDSFQEALSVREEPKLLRHAFLFHTPLGEPKRFFIVVMADPDDNKKTQLATVSYIQSYYGIFKGGDILDEQRRSTIKKVLKKAGITFSDDNTESLARLRAYRYGLSVTESKLLTLRSLPPHSKAILTGLTLMAVIMTGMRKYDYITTEMFETFWIFTGFAILFDLLPLLRIKRRKLS
jgi:hypothetical protein